MLAVTATAREAEDLTAALGSFLPPDSVAYFPGWETLPHERLSPRLDTVGQRIAVLRRLAHPAGPGEPNGPLTVVVSPVRSMLQPIVAGLGDLEPVALRVGQSCELDDLLARLVEIGYSRADLVGSRGEIAVRGGIVDVFPPTEEHPLRIEFFGDTVEEIRYFKVADQRSIGPAEHGLWAPPCRELLLTPAVKTAGQGTRRHPPGAGRHPRQAGRGDRRRGHGGVRPGAGGADGTAPGLRPGGRHRARLRPGTGPRPGRGTRPDEPGVPGGVLGERRQRGKGRRRWTWAPRDGRHRAAATERVRARAEELVRTSQEFLEASWVNAAAGGEAPVDLGAAAFQPIARIRAAAAALGLPWWTIAPFGVTDAASPAPTQVRRLGRTMPVNQPRSV